MPFPDGIIAWSLTIVTTLVTCAGQLALNRLFRRADEKRDAARFEDAEKDAEKERWRNRIDERMNEQDERIRTILQAQCTQMRSDIIQKCSRYLDDLGRASTEEKEALKAEHEDYSRMCEANDTVNTVNSFVDLMVRRVMDLPEREA